MSERRVVKVTDHALALIADIFVSTAGLYKEPNIARDNLYGRIQGGDSVSIGRFGEFFVGFEDHLPFGFFGLTKLEDCGELFGPFLYREFIGKDYGEYILNYSIDLAKTRDMKLLFLILPEPNSHLIHFFSHQEFITVSDNSETIKNWRDGILSHRKIVDGNLLLVRLLEPED